MKLEEFKKYPYLLQQDILDHDYQIKDIIRITEEVIYKRVPGANKIDTGERKFIVEFPHEFYIIETDRDWGNFRSYSREK